MEFVKRKQWRYCSTVPKLKKAIISPTNWPYSVIKIIKYNKINKWKRDKHIDMTMRKKQWRMVTKKRNIKTSYEEKIRNLIHICSKFKLDGDTLLIDYSWIHGIIYGAQEIFIFMSGSYLDLVGDIYMDLSQNVLCCISGILSWVDFLVLLYLSFISAPFLLVSTSLCWWVQKLKFKQ